MTKPVKTILFIIIGFMTLLAMVALGLLVFMDIDAHRARVETVASSALGMEVRIGGDLTIGLLPMLHITLEDVHLAQQGTEVASVEKVRLGIDLLPLLQAQIHIGTLALKQPRIFIERQQNGTFNYEKTANNSDAEATLGWSKIVLTQGTLIFADQQSGTGFEASDCNLEIGPLRPANWKVADLPKNLTFTAELACGAIRSHDLTLAAVNISATGKTGVIDIKPATMQVFGAMGSGSLHADLTGAVPRYDLRYQLPAFRIEKFFKILSPQQVAIGAMDFSADLSTQGKTLREVRQAVMGKISLRGKNIKLIGRDLDQEFSHFESSQNFNLIDVGAVFFAGPLGLLVTKGYNFASNLQDPDGHSEIRTLISDWQVEQGVAQAQDVALATDKYRVALKGGVDLVDESFNDLTLALIDAEGCAMVSQRIRGSFSDPQVEKPSFLKSLVGPVENVLSMGRNLLPGGECEAFYAGSVAQPK